MWIARDKDNYLCLYESKPRRGQSEWSSTDIYETLNTGIELGRIPIDETLFSNITWENSPVEIEFQKTVNSEHINMYASVPDPETIEYLRSIGYTIT